MSNKNYINGRAFEYRVKKYFESKGYLAFRTAGSHGIADIIVINNDKIELIQCKAINLTAKQRMKIFIKMSKEIDKYKNSKMSNVILNVLGLNNFKDFKKIHEDLGNRRGMEIQR